MRFAPFWPRIIKKGLLRHASVTTTQKHYIKEVPEITQKAMEKVETLCTNRATVQATGPH